MHVMRRIYHPGTRPHASKFLGLLETSERSGVPVDLAEKIQSKCKHRISSNHNEDTLENIAALFPNNLIVYDCSIRIDLHELLVS